MDEIPTKRRSGAHAIMKEACRDTEHSLVGLLEDSAYASVHGEAKALLSEIRSLAKNVGAWQATPVTELVKQGQIQRIIDISESARALAGHRDAKD
ncbi:MAG: hypothetical protein U0414_31780 [Polyangiaceae bacterium]